MSVLITINMIMTITFIVMKHPLSAGAILLLQTLTMTMLTGNLYQNFWFSYILFLIMVGGMLILFMYMTSIASNEKFKPNMKMSIISVTLIIVPMLIWESTKNVVSNNETLKFMENLTMQNTLSKFINMPLTPLLLFLMVYLLLAMIATVKITSFKQGSIRQMN
uniref:NADH-ubiquinone oxidoreductase chain 6 n=1 Tax=Tenebrionoidea sp. 11 KM-2017 TaxID=2219466 RepID=A0A346RII1_9CUCU|nr:NADH dehydrogenase subunit 6 [Tenebrionoidea sp. 11 KM-2017]